MKTASTNSENRAALTGACRAGYGGGAAVLIWMEGNYESDRESGKPGEPSDPTLVNRSQETAPQAFLGMRKAQLQSVQPSDQAGHSVRVRHVHNSTSLLQGLGTPQRAPSSCCSELTVPRAQKRTGLSAACGVETDVLKMSVRTRMAVNSMQFLTKARAGRKELCRENRAVENAVSFAQGQVPGREEERSAWHPGGV